MAVDTSMFVQLKINDIPSQFSHFLFLYVGIYPTIFTHPSGEYVRDFLNLPPLNGKGNTAPVS